MRKVFHQQGWKIDMTFITHCLLLNEKIFCPRKWMKKKKGGKNSPKKKSSIHSFVLWKFSSLIWYVSKAPEARSQKSWVIGIDEGTLESIFKVSFFWGGKGFLILSSEWPIIQLHGTHKFDTRKKSIFHHLSSINHTQK